jgi:hypothetical protein
VTGTRSTRCPACFEPVDVGVRLEPLPHGPGPGPDRPITLVCHSCGEKLRINDETGQLSTAHP